MSCCVTDFTIARRGVICAAMAFLASCATSQTPTIETSRNLQVCPGRVSNAPSTTNERRIKNFSPVARVRGQDITRAPVVGCVSSGFGPRRGGAGRFHHGVDVFTRTPVTVHAGGDGVVETVKSVRGYGKTVVIRHKRGVKTRYAHLSSYADGLRAGRNVRRGEAIGKTGATGNATAIHLHYEILIDGKAKNPLSVGR